MPDTSQSSTVLDKNFRSVPIMEPDSSETISVTSTTANQEIGKGKVCTVRVSEDAFFNLGDSAVEATTGDFFILAGETQDIPMGANTHLAMIRSSADATAYITIYK